MVIPCLYSFLLTVLRTLAAEPPINKKRTRTLSRKESGSSTNCMLGHDSTDVFRALLAKLIEEPEEKQTFDRLLEMAENLAAKH